jgi:hypothetical protein
MASQDGYHRTVLSGVVVRDETAKALFQWAIIYTYIYRSEFGVVHAICDSQIHIS